MSLSRRIGFIKAGWAMMERAEPILALPGVWTLMLEYNV